MDNLDNEQKNKRFLNLLMGLPPEEPTLNYASPEEAAFGTSSQMPEQEDPMKKLLEEYPLQPQTASVNKQKPSTTSAPKQAVQTSSVVEPVMPQMPEGTNYLKDYDEAKKNQRLMDLVAGVSRGASDVAAGIGRSNKPDYGSAEMFEKQGAQGVANIGERQKIEKMQEEFNSAQAERDPNSAISQSYRDLYKKMSGGKEPPGKPSAAHLKSLLPQLEKMYFIEQKTKSDLESRRKESEEKDILREDRLKRTREGFDEKADKAIEKISSNFQDDIGAITTARSEAELSKTNPQAAKNLPRVMIKAVEGSGARVTDADYKNAIGSGAVPARVLDTLKMLRSGTIRNVTVDQLNEMLDAAEKVHRMKKENLQQEVLKNYARRSGQDYNQMLMDRGMTQPTEATKTSMVHMRAKDGREFDVPSDKVEAAKKRGLEEVK